VKAIICRNGANLLSMGLPAGKSTFGENGAPTTVKNRSAKLVYFSSSLLA